MLSPFGEVQPKLGSQAFGHPGSGKRAVPAGYRDAGAGAVQDFVGQFARERIHAQSVGCVHLAVIKLEGRPVRWQRLAGYAEERGKCFDFA